MTSPQRKLGDLDALSAKAKDLLRRADVDDRTEPRITRLSGGGNNGVFRVDIENGCYILKQYFSHPEDRRDRFGAETAFAGFLWRHEISVIPQLLATDKHAGLALFQYVEGRPLAPSEVDASHVDQAAGFCRDLFRIQSLPDARELPLASEACFSIQDHLDCVGQRLTALKAIPVTSEVHGDALRFADDDLKPCWTAVRSHVKNRIGSAGQSLDRVLPANDRVLSPSDFGFHNALLTNSGRLCFFDFEYAGWDDPAKLICDFFCQVEVPAPRPLLPEFIESLLSERDAAGSVRERVECLFPVYLLKWCAIVLNDFLPVASARRQFSTAGPPTARRLELQLEKARQLLRGVQISREFRL